MHNLQKCTTNNNAQSTTMMMHKSQYNQQLPTTNNQRNMIHKATEQMEPVPCNAQLTKIHN